MGSVSAQWQTPAGWQWTSSNWVFSWYTEAQVGWTFRREMWVNGVKTIDQTGGSPLSAGSTRYDGAPPGTTIEHRVTAFGQAGNERDRAWWGPGAAPYPPTPDFPAPPQISLADAGVNRWNVTIGGGAISGNIKQAYVADAANGEPLYANGGDGVTFLYAMPVGVRSATIRGRGYNQGPYGATNGPADSFLALSSENTAPNAPTALAWAAARARAGVTTRLSWTHSDPNGDAQTGSEVQYRDVGRGGGWISLGVVNSADQFRDIAFATPGTYRVQVRTKDWEGFYGPWSAESGDIVVFKTQVRVGDQTSGSWIDSVEDYVRSGGLWVPTRKLKLTP